MLTTKEAADKLGVSTRTVQRMADERTLNPTVRYPGQTGPLLFDEADVERVRKARKTAA